MRHPHPVEEVADRQRQRVLARRDQLHGLDLGLRRPSSPSPTAARRPRCGTPRRACRAASAGRRRTCPSPRPARSRSASSRNRSHGATTSRFAVGTTCRQAWNAASTLVCSSGCRTGRATSPRRTSPPARRSPRSRSRRRWRCAADVRGSDVVVARVAAELVDQEGGVVVGDDDDRRVGPSCLRAWGTAVPWGYETGRCGCGSTSPTTARTSTAGPSSPGCAPCRASSRERSPRSSGSPRSPVTCAGRTDTGVHARGQVTHVDVDADVRTSATACAAGWTACCRADIRVRRVVAAADGFDARFSAVWRRYAYRIVDDPAADDPLTRGHVLAWRRAARRRRDQRRVEGAARPPRLRVVLQAARGRDHHPHAARPVVGARRRRRAGRDRAGRRVLPPHGALAGGLPGGGRRGSPSRRPGPATCSRPPPATRPSPSRPPTA